MYTFHTNLYLIGKLLQTLINKTYQNNLIHKILLHPAIRLFYIKIGLRGIEYINMLLFYFMHYNLIHN